MARKNNLKLDRAVRNTKGSIALYTEYIPYRQQELKTAAEQAKQHRRDKLAAELAAIDFYRKDTEEVYNTIAAIRVEEKRKALRMKYRKQRETNKRAAAKNPELQSQLDEQLAAYQAELDQQLAEYEREIKESIQKEREKGGDKDFNALYEDTLQKGNAECLAFEQKIDAKTEAQCRKVEEKTRKKLDKLEEKLEKQVAELKELAAGESLTLPDGVILDIHDLCMYFGGLHAVDHLSFHVKEGEVFGLIGPNGAGKTTVFNCLTQFNKPTSGDIHFRTKEGDIVDLNKEAVHDIITLGIARTFQNVEVVGECTVLENMLIAASSQYQSKLWDHMLHSRLMRLEEQVITQRALKVLDFMGLKPYTYMYAMGLPYGVLKKIEIARTLMTQPQLIILDEPAAGLNDTETKELEELINRIRKEYNCTILLVEHDMGLVMSICDRICAISFGKFLACGTPKEIQSNPQVQEAYLGKDEEAEVKK